MMAVSGELAACCRPTAALLSVIRRRAGLEAVFQNVTAHGFHFLDMALGIGRRIVRYTLA